MSLVYLMLFREFNWPIKGSSTASRPHFTQAMTDAEHEHSKDVSLSSRMRFYKEQRVKQLDLNWRIASWHKRHCSSASDPAGNRFFFNVDEARFLSNPPLLFFPQAEHRPSAPFPTPHLHTALECTASTAAYTLPVSPWPRRSAFQSSISPGFFFSIPPRRSFGSCTTQMLRCCRPGQGS